VDRPTTKEVARFFDKVNITKHCWLWIASFTTVGYGQFSFRYKMVGAHRFSYELFIGQIPEGMHVLHKKDCGNRSCVNPNHLYMGTHADNMRDKVMWGNFIFGESHHKAKLTNKDVLEIRRLYNLPSPERPSQRTLGKKFWVGKSQISSIIRHQAWTHLP